MGNAIMWLLWKSDHYQRTPDPILFEVQSLTPDICRRTIREEMMPGGLLHAGVDAPRERGTQ